MYDKNMISVQEYKLDTLLKGLHLLLAFSIIHGSQVRFNPSHYNKILEGEVMEAKKVPTYSVCVYECMVTTDCQSFNYYMDDRLCVFHSDNSSTSPQCIFNATGRVRYSDISIWPKISQKSTKSQLWRDFFAMASCCINLHAMAAFHPFSYIRSVAGACSDIDCPPGQRCYPSEPTSICLETATFIDTCDGTFLAVGNSRLPDSSLNASSSYGANTGPERGRLNTTEGDYTGAWASATLGLQHWIQVDLQELTIVRGIMSQGRNLEQQWVTEYKVLYSADCEKWTYLGGADEENATVFPGNTDPDTIVTNMLECPVIARCVRLNPISWNYHISMRFDVIGCSTNSPGLVID